MGHFVSFILTILQFALLLNTFYFFVEDVEILATMRTLVFFFVPATEFLIHPMVETIFSEKLRETFNFSSIWWGDTIFYSDRAFSGQRDCINKGACGIQGDGKNNQIIKENDIMTTES